MSVRLVPLRSLSALQRRGIGRVFSGPLIYRESRLEIQACGGAGYDHQRTLLSGRELDDNGSGEERQGGGAGLGRAGN